jgi:hypothetical protein
MNDRTETTITIICPQCGQLHDKSEPPLWRDGYSQWCITCILALAFDLSRHIPQRNRHRHPVRSITNA